MKSQVEEQLSNYISRLELVLHKYTYTSLRTETYKSGTVCTELKYLNESKNMTLSISILHSNNDLSDIFITEIERSDIKKDRRMSFDELAVKYNHRLGKLSVNEGSDTQAFIDNYMTELLVAFTSYFKKYIDGSVWEATPFDMSFYEEALYNMQRKAIFGDEE